MERIIINENGMNHTLQGKTLFDCVIKFVEDAIIVEYEFMIQELKTMGSYCFKVKSDSIGTWRRVVVHYTYPDPWNFHITIT